MLIILWCFSKDTFSIGNLKTYKQTNKQSDYVGLKSTVVFMLHSSPMSEINNLSYFILYIPKGYCNIEIYVLSLVIKYIMFLNSNIL